MSMTSSKACFSLGSARWRCSRTPSRLTRALPSVAEDLVAREVAGQGAVVHKVVREGRGKIENDVVPAATNVQKAKGRAVDEAEDN